MNKNKQKNKKNKLTRAYYMPTIHLWIPINFNGILFRLSLQKKNKSAIFIVFFRFCSVIAIDKNEITFSRPQLVSFYGL